MQRAIPGDEIVVAPGVYLGDGNTDIRFNVSPLVLRSIDPTDPGIVASTVIDASPTGVHEKDKTRNAFDLKFADNDSVVAGFTITGATYSAAIRMDSASPTFKYCRIVNNNSSAHSALYLVKSNPTFWYCTFAGNSSEDSSAIYSYSSCPGFVRCVFFNNSTTEFDYSVLSGFEGHVTFTHCIIWNNPFHNIHYNVMGMSKPVDGDCASLTVKYCCVENGIHSIKMKSKTVLYYQNNIDKNPLFRDPDNFDFHLQDGSPCVDAGNPELTAGILLDIDFEGNPAIRPAGPDLGIDEVHQIFHVPKDCPTIQEAINAAADDENNPALIILSEGTYTGLGNRDLDSRGKKLIIMSKKPYFFENIRSTVIDVRGSESSPHFGIRFQGAGQPTMIGVTIMNAYDYHGGAVQCISSSPLIENCIFENNRGYYGGSYYAFNSAATIRNCIFKDNSSLICGGAMYLQDSPTVINNCTFIGNSAETGPGMSVYSTGIMDPYIDSSVLCGGAGSHIFGNVNATYCNVANYPGEGNIYADPMVDPCNMALSIYSPCVDAGNPKTIEPGFDIDGNRRVNNGRIDIGAYESTGLCFRHPDLNNDSSVDLFDFGLLSGSWFCSAGAKGFLPVADQDCSGLIGAEDMLPIFDQWLCQGYPKELPTGWLSNSVWVPEGYCRLYEPGGLLLMQGPGIEETYRTIKVKAAYFEYNNPFMFSCRVAFIEKVNENSMAGIIMPHIGGRHPMEYSWIGEIACLYQTVLNGTHLSNNLSNWDDALTDGKIKGTPVWLRIVYDATVITGYESLDGISWETVGKYPYNIFRHPPGFIGLFVSSNENGRFCSALFDNIVFEEY